MRRGRRNAILTAGAAEAAEPEERRMSEYVAEVMGVCMANDQEVAEVRFRPWEECFVVELIAHDGRQIANSKRWTHLNAESGRATAENLLGYLRQQRAA